MEIQNHSHDVKAVITFRQAGWFARDLNRVDGFVYSKGEKVRFLYGKWTDYLKSAGVEEYEEYLRESPQRSFKPPDKPVDNSVSPNGSTTSTPSKVLSKVNSIARSLAASSLEERTSAVDAEEDGLEGEIPKSDSSQSLDIANSRFLWRVTPRPEFAQDYYNFTALSMTLNQELPGMRDYLAPTDSRFRPDVRVLEQGDVGA